MDQIDKLRKYQKLIEDEQDKAAYEYKEWGLALYINPDGTGHVSRDKQSLKFFDSIKELKEFLDSI